MNDLSETRLRLRHPVLLAWRDPGVLQLGFDERPLLLKGVPDPLRRAVELLGRPRSPRELAALLPELEPCWVDWLCEHLSTAGMLTGAPAPSGSVLVCGNGPLAEAVHAAIRAGCAGVRRVEECPDLVPQGQLVVVAANTAEPDRAALNALTGRGVPHLVVRAEPARAVVGPLVEPGRGACVRCDDLARAHLDRRWPVLLAQLCRTQVRPDPGLVGWAAATAACQVRGWLADGTAEAVGRTIEVGLADFRLRSRSWPVQPGCGCHRDGWATPGTLAG